MANDDLSKTIRLLTDRLERIEARLGLPPVAQTTEQAETSEVSDPSALTALAASDPVTSSARTAPKAVTPAPAQTIPPPPAPAETPAAPPTTPQVNPSAPPIVAQAGSATLGALRSKRETLPTQSTRAAVAEARREAERRQSTSEHPPVKQPHASTEPGREPNRLSLEMLIGGKWMAWVGAIVVVVGAGFLAKAMNVAAMWTGLSGLAKVAILATFGAVLIAAGEYIFRRIGRVAAVGLFSAGLGVLYLAAYSTFGLYHLLTEPGAFVMLGVVAGLGLGLTLRTRSLTIAVLSIVAAYLAPILLSGAGSTFAAALPLYLTVVSGIGLALSLVSPKPFRPLRYVMMAGQVVVGAFWLTNTGNPWQLMMVFGAIWWVMVLADTIITAHREAESLNNITLVVLATGLYTTTTTWLLYLPGTDAQAIAGGFVLGVAVLSAVAALQFGSGIEVWTRRPVSPLEQLTLTLWLLVGALLPVAVALQFDGAAQSIGWLSLGLIGVEAGRRVRSSGLAVFGLIVGSLGAGRVLLLDWWMPSMGDELFSFAGVDVTRWAILMLVTIAACVGVAYRLRTDSAKSWRSVPVVLMSLATLYFVVVTLAQCDVRTQTVVMLLGAVGLFAMARPGALQRTYLCGASLMLLAIGKWVVVDTLMHRASPVWSVESLPLIVNVQLVTGLALVAATPWMLRRWTAARVGLGGREWFSDLRAFIIAMLPLAVMWGLMFELDRGLMLIDGVRAGGYWSIAHLQWLWQLVLVGVGGVAMIVLGRRWSQDLMSRFGAVATMIAAATWLLIPTLGFRVTDGAVSSAVVANPQFAAGVLIALAVAGAIWLGRTARDPGEAETEWWQQYAPIGGGLITGIVLWLGSFEIDRLIELQVSGTGAEWAGWHLRLLYLSIFWAAGGFVLYMLGTARRSSAASLAGLGILAIACTTWLAFAAGLARAIAGPVESTLIANPQSLTGLALGVLIVLTMIRSGRQREPLLTDPLMPVEIRELGFAALAIIGLTLGTLEIDRLFAPELNSAANAAMARQTGFSIFWGIYGLGMVTAGFLRPTAVARYAGLALLGITLGKVALIDTGQLEGIYRPISLIGIGLLFVATSIGYARLSPQLLRRDQETNAPPSTNGEHVTV